MRCCWFRPALPGHRIFFGVFFTCSDRILTRMMLLVMIPWTLLLVPTVPPPPDHRIFRITGRSSRGGSLPFVQVSGKKDERLHGPACVPPICQGGPHHAMFHHIVFVFVCVFMFLYLYLYLYLFARVVWSSAIFQHNYCELVVQNSLQLKMAGQRSFIFSPKYT